MNEILEVLKSFFTQPAWLIPAAVSVAVQLALTHRLKPFLPVYWQTEYRDAIIWAMSSVIGIFVFVPTRWAWLVLDGKPFGTADFVLSVMIALLIIGAMPWVYSKLPESLRKRYSYQKKVEQREKP